MTATTAENRHSFADTAALITLPIRLVIGWTYFSAFWRRVVVADKLDPNLPGYIGEKFNHFLPNALGIGPLIDALLTHPELLRVAMTVFTFVEGVVGACIMAGLLTRTMSVAVFGLAFGILTSAGWLGTTCLDEWQIGILGVAGGFTLFLAGGGRYSLDGLLARRRARFTHRAWFGWAASGPVPLKAPAVLGGSAAILVLALFTNQHFHGGLYGPLHNKSVAPRLEIFDARVTDDTLRFEVYRTEGADVYGAFVIGVAVVDDATGAKPVDVGADRLATLPGEAIANRYIAKVAPGAHSLIVPLGAKAQVNIATDAARFVDDHRYTLVLTDVSGASWTGEVQLGG